MINIGPEYKKKGGRIEYLLEKKTRKTIQMEIKQGKNEKKKNKKEASHGIMVNDLSKQTFVEFESY